MDKIDEMDDFEARKFTKFAKFVKPRIPIELWKSAKSAD